VNTIAEATVPEKILLAAYQLEKEGQSPFSAEALIVASWQKFKKTFGLKGYAEFYPDSNKVLSTIMGGKGLVHRRWLDKKGQKLYVLTREGQNIVRKLRQAGEQPEPDASPELSRDQDKLLLHLLGTTAVQKFDDERRDELKFPEACRFWGISEDMPPEALDSQLRRVRTSLRELGRLIPPEGWELSNGRSISDEDLDHLAEVDDYMEERFSRHLNLWRTRSEKT
jgi:hypothetical protein